MPRVSRRQILEAAVAVWVGLGGRESESSPDRSVGDMKLWYRKPAESWNEALPVGNGRLGAMVFGKTDVDRIQLNEETVWSGSAFESVNSEALENLRPCYCPRLCC